MKNICALLILGLLLPTSLKAAELTIISGGAVRPGLVSATEFYKARTGHNIRLVFNSTPQIKQRLAAGETFDVVIAPPGAMAKFLESGKVKSEGALIGRVGAGIAVRRGAKVPEIKTTAQLKHAVLQAEALIFNRSSSGQYIEELLNKMEIWQQVQPKTRRYQRADDVIQQLLKGTGRELGFAPITKIIANREKGLDLVGALPSDVQKLRAYKAAIMTNAGSHKAAAEFIEFLVSAEGKPLLRAAGIE